MTLELMTIEEFCRRTSTGKTRVYQEIRDGRLQAIKYGRCTRITREAMEQWIANLPQYGEK